MDNEKPQSGGRLYYLDVLRILAVFSVMIIHVTAKYWPYEPVTGYNWRVLNAYDQAAHFAVPMFVMISGALWLAGGKLDYKKLYTKNALRIVTAFLFWSALYAVLHAIILPHMAGKDLSIREFVYQTAVGRYHLWYCYMILGIYLVLPLLKPIADNEKLLRYFLLLSFVTAFLLPSLQTLPVLSKTRSITDDLNINIGKGYVFYFMAGYYLWKTEIPKKIRLFVYLFGLISVVGLIVGSTYSSARANTGVYNSYFSHVFEVGRTLAIFVLFQYAVKPGRLGEKIRRGLVRASNLCFGVYLIHDFFLSGIDQYVVKAVDFNPLFSVPLISAALFVVSYACACVLKRIPAIGKYIT